MIGLFFEVQSREGHQDQYLNLAASLRPALDAIGGCLFIDRFKSLSRKNLLLSYQIWRDEGALTAWRVHGGHHKVHQHYLRQQVLHLIYSLLAVRCLSHDVHIRLQIQVGA